jgi:hypothetical protein
VINELVLEILPYDFLLDTKNAKSKKTKILRTRKMKTYLEPKEIDRIEQAAECLRDKLLVRLETLSLSPLLDIPETRQAVLESAIGRGGCEERLPNIG